MVTVEATDSENNMAERSVMVRVTDVVGVLAIGGMSSIDYPENGDGPGGDLHGDRFRRGLGCLGSVGRRRWACSTSMPAY